MEPFADRPAEPRSARDRTADQDGNAPPKPAVDRDRLVWDPEYRQEIARLLREA